jgi:tetratricopeptide (TPR) repeat protein
MSQTEPKPPALSPEAAFRLATALHRAGRLDEAESLYRAFIRANPDYHKAQDNLGSVLLAKGQFAEAWPLHEGRFTRAGKRVDKPALSFPEWLGEPLAGKSILIWPEQGFGDLFLFARFVSVLRAQGARVTLLCPSPVAALFAQLGEVIVAAGQVQIPPHDYWSMIGSLPLRLGATIETLPAPPYLYAEPSGPGGIGFAWQGDMRNPNLVHRSLTPVAREALKALAPMTSLQPEDSGAKDFLETAALIAGMDLVITIDTAVANLAGAMGKDCWVMLPKLGADWRWMRGDRTPWYPCCRLFRQPSPDDWSTVIADIGQALFERQPKPAY